MSAKFDNLERNHGIDALRGFAVLLVILLHINIRIPIARTELGLYLPTRFVWTFFTMGYEAVFIFFVVSGFLICRNVLSRYGDLTALDMKSFYIRRAGRILPCLVLLVGILSLLAWIGFSSYRLDASASLMGAASAAFGLYMNVYLSFVSPLPPSWDVLWSLSIEEVFYLGFPLVCLAMRWGQGGGLWGITILALALPIVHPNALTSNETWAEKAYWPGMSGIAMGIVASFATRWLSVKRLAVPLRAGGLIALVAALGWEDKLVRLLGVGGDLLVLTGGTAILLVSLACEPIAMRKLKPLLWLGVMGRSSYEIYLTHMFIVLEGVELFKHSGAAPQFGYLWYPPIVLLAVVLGGAVAHFVSNPLDRAVRQAFLDLTPVGRG